MRSTLVTILFCSLTNVLLSQSTDTTNLDTINIHIVTTDSVDFSISNPLGIEFTSSGPDVFWTPIPTCSCLNLKNDKFFLENDSIPYSGSCVVTNMYGSGYYLYQYSKYSAEHFGGKLYLSNFIFCEGPCYIKIISNYNDGKRNGNREYYDKSGKLIKTEVYDNGVLIKTIYQ
jgi:hypothetical protein